jgi:hypothetical protein
MARRKTGYLSDGESSGDSAGDSDVDAFDGQRKRQKRAGNGKEAALYGVFADDDDADDGGLGTRRERGKRVDFTKYVCPLQIGGDGRGADASSCLLSPHQSARLHLRLDLVGTRPAAGRQPLRRAELRCTLHRSIRLWVSQGIPWRRRRPRRRR